MGPACNKLAAAATKVAASESFLPVKAHVIGAKRVEQGGRFYIAVSNSLINLIVKPARKYPADALRRDSKKNLLGLFNKGWWQVPGPNSQDIVVEGDKVESAVPVENYLCKDTRSSVRLA